MSRLPVSGFKLLLVLACIAGAVMSANRSRLVFLSRLNPEAALAADATYAPAALLLGNVLFAKDPKGDAERRIQLARAALHDQPLAAEAIRQIGMARDAGRVAPETRPYMTLADEMSRRDGLAQIWLAQDRFKAGKVLGAMARIDTVMRVNRQAQDLIFPLLSRFTNAPGIATALAVRSDAGAEWVADYLLYELAKGGDRRTIANVLLAINRPERLREGANTTSETVRELAVAGDGARARALFLRAARIGIFGSDRAKVATPWRVFDRANAAAEWREVGGEQMLDVLVEAGASGIVAQQVRFDGPAHRLQPRLVEPRMPTGSRLTLTVQCGPSGPLTTVWSAVGSAQEHKPAVRSGSAGLPGTCPAPVYSIEVAGPREGEPLAASLAGIGSRVRSASR